MQQAPLRLNTQPDSRQYDPLNLQQNRNIPLPKYTSSYVLPSSQSQDPNQFYLSSAAQMSNTNAYRQNPRVYGRKSEKQDSVGQLIAIGNAEQSEKPKQNLFTSKQAQFGVSPNDVQISRLNQKIKSYESAITKAENNVTQSALRV